MKAITEKTSKKAAFTIIELLTVMSIIVILFGLLVPAMTTVKRYAKMVKQQAQFHAIEAGLQMFHDDFDGYPPSDAMDRNPDGTPIGGNTDYPGALKLAEAMLGHDLLGFNPNSIFKADGTNPAMNEPTLPNSGKTLYPPIPAKNPDIQQVSNMRLRKDPYISVEKVTMATVGGLYGNQSPPSPQRLVICDEFPRVRVSSGRRVGLPVLYYKANTSSMLNPDPNEGLVPALPQNTTYIYNHLDNQAIINLKAAWDGLTANPISNGGTLGEIGFYKAIQNSKISSPPRPYNQDTFILMSAGNDGLYGTNDDVFNFVKE